MFRYEGYVIAQHENGDWDAFEETESGFEVVIDRQKTAQDCIDFINDFLI